MEQPRLGCLFSQPVRATNLDLALAHAQSLCCFAPDVAVVETAHTGKPDNPGTRRWSRFERPPVRRISQPRMNAFSVVVGDVFTKPSMQMPFIEDNDVVQQFAATSADPSFGDPVLPGASIGGPHRLCAKAAKGLPNSPREDRVAVVYEIRGCRRLRKGLAELLNDPQRRGIRRDVEVHELPTSVSQKEPHIQHSEANGRDRKEVHRRNSISMIPKEGPPPLQLRAPGESLGEVSRDRGEAHRETELLEFRLDFPCSPGILHGEPMNQFLPALRPGGVVDRDPASRSTANKLEIPCGATGPRCRA